MNASRILVVDDELTVVQECTRALTRGGHSVTSALTPSEALDKLPEAGYEVVFLDLKFAYGKGAELLKVLRDSSPATAVVIMHGLAPIAAVTALGSGVYEYLCKPFDTRELMLTLDRALQRRAMLLQAIKACRDETVTEFGELIGTGPAMRALFKSILKVAPTGSMVLLFGREGTGKALAAEAIHRVSNRRGEPFVRVSTMSFDPPGLAETVFGRVEGSGASARLKAGKIAEAGSGTFYLDEITALNRWSQEQLLEAIRRRTYLPVGGGRSLEASCRFMFGTRRDLGAAMAQGGFLDELFYGVSVFPIYLPSLSERSEDIPALAYKFLHQSASRFGRSVSRIDDRLLSRLAERPWPGNIRELERCIQRSVAVCEGDILTLEHYERAMDETGFHIWRGKPPSNVEELKAAKRHLRRTAVAEVERAFVLDALQRNNGNVTRAAQDVGLHRRNFQTLMRTYGIKSG